LSAFFKHKKAFTLLELSIVIALVSIVGAAVVSLCVLVSNAAHKNSNHLAFMQETTLVQTLVQNFADTNANSINKNMQDSPALSDDFKFEDNLLKVENNKEYTFDTINNIEFTVDIIKDGEIVKDFLIICKLSLNGNYATDGSDVFTFTVNPYVGESA
jgi:prepilin-type N-terminal cleavage/methylation domain-containing protein